MSRRTNVIVSLLWFGSWSCGGTSGPAFPPTFSNVNAKIFQPTCALSTCHQAGAGANVGGLDLSTNPYQALLGSDGTGAPATNPQGYPYAYPGWVLVKPGETSKSLLFLKVTQGGVVGCSQSMCPYGEQMPYNALPLPSEDVESLREWIANGAKND